MKSPINIAKRSYSEILRIDEIFARLDQLSTQQKALEQAVAENNTLLQNIYNNKSVQDKLDFLITLIKYTTDITKIPKATGLERTIQEANFTLYKKIAKILKANHITFFVDFGILIGLARHNDFIPWDDDIDISVPRTEYEKLPKLFKSVFKDSGLKYVESEIIRVYYKNTPLQIDIFPLDFYDQQLNDADKAILKKKVIKYQSLAHLNWDNLFSQQSILISPTLNDLRAIYHKAICKKDIDLATAKQLKSTIIHSPESQRGDRTYILDYDDIFPLKETTLLGEKVPIPNNIHRLLIKYYGDYLSFPDDLGQKHRDIESRIKNIAPSDLEQIINTKGNLK